MRSNFWHASPARHTKVNQAILTLQVWLHDIYQIFSGSASATSSIRLFARIPRALKFWRGLEKQ